MVNTLQLAVIAALSLTLVAAVVTETSGSATTANFASSPNKVLSIANTTDAATKWNTVPYDWAVFGPGATNATIYLFGVLPDQTTANTVTGIISRSIDASVVSAGTDSTEASVKSDTTAAASFLYGSLNIAAGGGYAAVQFTQTDTTTPFSTNVYTSIVAGGSSSLAATKVALSANTNTVWASATTDGLTYTYNLYSAVYTGAAFYYAYVTTATTVLKSAATSSTSPTTAYTLALQGVFVNGTKVWTSPVSVATSSTYRPRNVMIAPSNSSNVNSTSILITYSGSSTTVNSISVKISDGSLGTASTVATDPTAVTVSSTVDGVTMDYAPGGLVGGEYNAGTLISNTTVVTAKGTTTDTTTYSLGYYNGSVTVASPLTTSAKSSIYGGGTTYGTGYALFAQYLSDTASLGTYSYVYGTFFANGTANGTQQTIATTTGAMTGSYFVDANGALWFGYKTYDSASTAPTSGTPSSGSALYSASVGKLIAQVNSSTGSILSTFFAFLLFVVASLFTF